MQIICTFNGAIAGLFTGPDDVKETTEANNHGFVCHLTTLKELPPGKLYDPETDTLSDDPAYVPPGPAAPDPQTVQDAIVAATQERLNAFARTRNYDGILSACTYATSAIPKFAAEGQCAVDARDATWVTLYDLLAQVLAGTRPMPTSYAEVEPLLPALTWPE